MRVGVGPEADAPVPETVAVLLRNGGALAQMASAVRAEADITRHGRGGATESTEMRLVLKACATGCTGRGDAYSSARRAVLRVRGIILNVAACRPI